MSSFNKFIAVGNVGKDPETRYTQSGTQVATFSIATSTYRKGPQGREETTHWHRCVAYLKTAEVVAQYVKAGDKLLIEGKVTYRKYNDKAGVEKQITEIIVDQLTMLGNKQRQGDDRPAPRRPAPSPRPSASDGQTAFDDMDDDIPF